MEIVDEMAKKALHLRFFTTDLKAMNSAYATIAGMVMDEFKRLKINVDSSVQQDTILYIYNVLHVLFARSGTTIETNTSYTSVFH
jgi:CBS domain containing-hemolysin-like protein